jgi:hypothetical protein
MKDQGGHGSNSKLSSSQGPSAPLPHVSGKPQTIGGHNFTQVHGGAPMSSNAQAAQALMSKLKSTQAPIHPAMAHPAMPSANNGSSS